MGMDPRLLLCIELPENVYLAGLDGSEDYMPDMSYTADTCKILHVTDDKFYNWSVGSPTEDADPCPYRLISWGWGDEISMEQLDEAYKEALDLVRPLQFNNDVTCRIYFTTDFS